MIQILLGFGLFIFSHLNLSCVDSMAAASALINDSRWPEAVVVVAAAAFKLVVGPKCCSCSSGNGEPNPAAAAAVVHELLAG